MLDKGKIDTVSVEADKITIIPKKQENPVMKTTYYAVRISDMNLVDRLEDAKKAGKLTDYESPEESGASTILSFLYFAFCLYIRCFLFPDAGPGRHDGWCRQKYGESLYGEKDRCNICRCSRTG